MAQTTGLARPIEINDGGIDLVPKPAENPFGALATREAGGAAGTAMAVREVAELRAQISLAHEFPRDQRQAVDTMLADFRRPKLAEQAQYSLPRGGKQIIGPSIRAAESMARAWGNLSFGWRTLDETKEFALIETMCWDMQTNVRAVRVVRVEYRMKAYGAMKLIEDPADRYLHVANMAARRMRSCILEMIPGDVVETCMAAATETLKISVDVTPAKIKALLETFEGYGISRAAIEKKIGRNIDHLTPAQMVAFRPMLQSLKDGMAKPEDLFDLEPTHEQTPAAGNGGTKLSAQAERLAKKAEELKAQQTAAAAAGAAKPNEPDKDESPKSDPPKAASAAHADGGDLFGGLKPPDFAKMSPEQLADAMTEAAIDAGISSAKLAEITQGFGGVVNRTNAPGIFSAIYAAGKQG